jgi:Tol biopolymer transport system component
MKQELRIIGFVLLAGCLLGGCSVEKNTTAKSGAYLGQKPPGLKPKIFAPNIVSTEKNELNCVFSPDGNEVYFSVWKEGVNTIMTMKRKDGRWSDRMIASFSGNYSDVDPYITLDGKKLYFSSMRPLNNTGDPKDSDIWYVEKTMDDDWGQPVRLDEPNSIGKDDYYTSISANGTLYFSVFETHGSPGDIYRSKLVTGQYTPAELVEYSISTEFNEHDPFIAPDESYLIFVSDRPRGYGRSDLYISFRIEDGAWTEPKNMGEEINSSGFDFTPILSPDSSYLFFTRNINGNGDIYWVDAKIIEELKPVN